MNQHSDKDRVAVAIDRDKGSQFALKWAIDHVLNECQSVTLIHVNNKSYGVPSSHENMVPVNQEVDGQAWEIFLPFRCFCTRKDIKYQEIMLESHDISKAIIDYTQAHMIDTLVLGASTRNGLVRRFKGPDIPTLVTKGTPDFTTIHVISKGKITSLKSATRSTPNLCPKLPQQIFRSPSQSPDSSFTDGDCEKHPLQRPSKDTDQIMSPFTRGKAANGRAYGKVTVPDFDISYVSTNRPSVDHNNIEFAQTPRLSTGSDKDRLCIESSFSDMRMSTNLSYNLDTSQSSSNCSGFSSASLNTDDVETEMRRLKQELRQTIDMYNAACKETLTAKQKAREFEMSRMEEDEKLEEALMSEETALAIVAKEKQKCRAALDAAEAAQKIDQLEERRRINIESSNAISNNDVRYRKYSIDDIEAATRNFSESLQIGEGGYGPVYKGTLDHTLVAIKVLRSDAAEGQSQFDQEVEILSRIRHPNMVILLGACPVNGCLVYEYMSNGSLEDRLLCKGNTSPLPWQARFRIAAEIGIGLLFLHQTKPEPLVHRDLKPGNILLDQNLVSKISDVGLARLVPPSVADTVTQYQMTQTVGTFCYIDPEYQQTGMLGTKSDIYSLGIIFLQLITGRSPMGLTYHVEMAIENGTFADILDPTTDWPIDETLAFALLSLKCAELRRKDRPDLAKVILPELNRLRDLGEETL